MPAEMSVEYPSARSEKKNRHLDAQRTDESSSLSPEDSKFRTRPGLPGRPRDRVAHGRPALTRGGVNLAARITRAAPRPPEPWGPPSSSQRRTEPGDPALRRRRPDASRTHAARCSTRESAFREIPVYGRAQ